MYKTRLVLTFLAVVVALSWYCPAQQILSVPGDYSTIQEALDSANPGDVIELAAGVYQESLVVATSITILGTTGSAEDVVIMPSSWDEVLIEIDAKDPLTVEFADMTFTQGWASRAIHVSGPHIVTFTGCVLDSNQVAIEAAADSTLKLEACTFSNNDAGILAQGFKRISVSNCHFDDNSIAIKSLLSGHTIVHDTTFQNNDWNDLWFCDGSTFEVSGCDFSEIYGEEEAAAISVDGMAQGEVRRCKFVGTSTPDRFNPGPNGYYPIANAIETKDAAHLGVYDSEFDFLRAAIMMWGGAYIWAQGNTARSCCNGAFRVYRPSHAEIHIIGNTVGAFGERPIWCCPLVSLSGSIQHPIEITDNVIGDTGGCLAFGVDMPLCSRGKIYPENEFKGTIYGTGNELTDYYRNLRQCPSWRSPFWPDSFIKE